MLLAASYFLPNSATSSGSKSTFEYIWINFSQNVSKYSLLHQCHSSQLVGSNISIRLMVSQMPVTSMISSCLTARVLDQLRSFQKWVHSFRIFFAVGLELARITLATPHLGNSSILDSEAEFSHKSVSLLSEVTELLSNS